MESWVTGRELPEVCLLLLGESVPDPIESFDRVGHLYRSLLLLLLILDGLQDRERAVSADQVARVGTGTPGIVADRMIRVAEAQ